MTRIVTEEEIIVRTLHIVKHLWDLKEDILFHSVPTEFDEQPLFNGGLMSGAIHILMANIPEDDPLYKAEIDRQCSNRLLRAIEQEAGKQHES